MITVIETRDNRVLETDRNDVDTVIKEAQNNGVLIENFENLKEGPIFSETCQSTCSYVLISSKHKFVPAYPL